MPFELTVLGLAVLLAVVQLALYAVPANRQLGVDYTLGPRDEQRPLTGIPARLHRAYQNHLEGMVLFGAATLVVVAGGASSAFTGGCAIAYLLARIVYVPCYALGIPYIRSAVWTVGFVATLLMVLAALF